MSTINQKVCMHNVYLHYTPRINCDIDIEWSSAETNQMIDIRLLDRRVERQRNRKFKFFQKKYEKQGEKTQKKKDTMWN